jgi:hypothetical protein
LLSGPTANRPQVLLGAAGNGIFSNVAAGINFRYVPHPVFGEPDVPIRSLGNSLNRPKCCYLENRPERGLVQSNQKNGYEGKELHKMELIQRGYARDNDVCKDVLALSHASVTAITWGRGDAGWSRADASRRPKQDCSRITDDPEVECQLARTGHRMNWLHAGREDFRKANH